MMEREWAALLARYGQSVALHRGEETVRTQAFLQPVTERDRAQEAPSPWVCGVRTAFYISESRRSR